MSGVPADLISPPPLELISPPTPDSYRSALALALRRYSRPLMLGACALAPYTTWRVNGDYLFTLSDMLFSLAALCLLFSRRLNMQPFGGLTILWLGGMSAMLLGFLVGSIVNGDPLRWLIVAGQYGFAYILLPMLFIHGDRDGNVREAKALILGVVLMELAGIIVYHVFHPTYAMSERISHEFITGGHRLGGFMADANWNAAMIAMTIPFVFYLSRTGRLSAVLAYPAIGILLWGLLLSGSFTGFTSMALATLTFLVVSGGTRAIRTAMVLVALVGAVAVSGITPPQVFENRVQEALEDGDLSRAGTFTGRMELIKDAWHMADERIFVGLGVDQFRVVSKDHAPVHNMFLLVWCEGSLLALLGWLFVLAVPLAVSIMGIARDRVAGALGLAVLVPFLAFAIAAPHMYSRSWVVPLILAMAIVLSRKVEIVRRHPIPSDDPEGVTATSKAPRVPARKSRILAA